MGVRENKVEKRISNGVKKLGGFTKKWGQQSNPDMVIFCQGVVDFIEVKTVDGPRAKQQERRVIEMCDQGASAFFIEGHKEADEYLVKLEKRINKC